MLAVGFVTTSLVACSDDDSNLITLSDDVPSFTITIPASAEFVLVDRKEATDTDYRRVFQVPPSLGFLHPQRLHSQRKSLIPLPTFM